MVTSKQRAERIEAAIEALKRVPQGKFHLKSWARLTDDELKAAESRDHRVALNGCGTTGCAMGWIASDPFARRRGLWLYASMYDGTFPVCGVLDDKHEPAGGPNVGFGAAMEYFGISAPAAETLFGPGNYSVADQTKVKHVITRLRALLSGGENALFKAEDRYWARIRGGE